MIRRPRLSPTSALCVSLFTSFALLAACSSEEDPADDTAAGKGGASGSAGTAPKGGSAGTSGGSAGTGTSGGGAGGSGTSGSAGSKAGGAGTGTSGGAGTSGGTGGTSAGGTGGTATGGTGGGSGGALGGAGAGGKGNGGGGGSAGGPVGGTGGTGGTGGGGTFTVTSPAFENSAECTDEMRATCEVFPDENISYQGSPNISPELTWTGVPAGTMSFAILLQDLSNGFAHWVLWNVPGTAMGLEADVPQDMAMPATPAGSQQCSLGTGDGYLGPGSECNVYQFIVYALSVETFSPTMATDANSVRTQLQALDDAILGSALLTGRSNFNGTCP